MNNLNEEFTSGDFLNKLMASYEATCGAAATNVFQPIRLSSYAVFMQLLCKPSPLRGEGRERVNKIYGKQNYDTFSFSFFA